MKIWKCSIEFKINDERLKESLLTHLEGLRPLLINQINDGVFTTIICADEDVVKLVKKDNNIGLNMFLEDKTKINLIREVVLPKYKVDFGEFKFEEGRYEKV